MKQAVVCSMVIDEIDVEVDSWLLIILELTATKVKCTLRLNPKLKKIELIGFEDSVKICKDFIRDLVNLTNKVISKDDYLNYALYQKGCIDVFNNYFNTKHTDKFNIPIEIKNYLNCIKFDNEIFKYEKSNWLDDDESFGYEMARIICEVYKEDIATIHEKYKLPQTKDIETLE